MDRLNKQLLYLSGYFYGKGMFNAINAMKLAQEWHTGTRKDDTPEFSHQMSLVSYIIPIFERHPFVFFENMVCAAFLHDIVEDYGYSLEQINIKYGSDVGTSVAALTKELFFDKSLEAYLKYYAGIIDAGPLTLFVKISDRLHNLSSMSGAPAAFPKEKIISYVDEVMTHMIPAAKNLRDEFPEHYQLLTFLVRLLENYCQMILHGKEFA
jgi:(p)ppGpp synthase/HD superfamily hydrolase